MTPRGQQLLKGDMVYTVYRTPWLLIWMLFFIGIILGFVVGLKVSLKVSTPHILNSENTTTTDVMFEYADYLDMNSPQD